MTGIYGGLQQPSVSIPVEITRLTGITDETVAGHSIDIAALQALIEPADLLIAHKCRFRPALLRGIFSSVFRQGLGLLQLRDRLVVARL